MYRGTFAIVDLRAVRDNVAAMRRVLSPGVKMLVAVKANGYGHGAAEVAKAAATAGADYFGVATVEEGIAIRAAGVQEPILVLGVVTYEAAKAAAKHRLDIPLTDDCLAWPQDPISPKLSVHLKVDTGMTRLGGRTDEECIALASWAKSRQDVECRGVFTHLACADASDMSHAEEQICRFQKILGILSNVGLQPTIIHAANSAAAMRRKEWQFDMVRIGIAAYGYPPSSDFTPSVEVKPALNLYSHITRTHVIHPGETVGYGATFTAQRQTLVATVPVGYADGYPRLLSNKSSVLVRGQRAPVIGNVCMDQLMLDVTDIANVAAGDCVTLYGHEAPASWNRHAWEQHAGSGQSASETSEWLKQTFVAQTGDVQVLGLDELAGMIGTISYELMCALSPRVPRIYVN